jgi:AmmeMemoRadiSam system protein A
VNRPENVLFPAFDPPAPPALSAQEGVRLVRIALRAIRSQWIQDLPARDVPVEGGLLAPAGAFVTVYRRQDLRGCLGLVGAKEPLWKTVEELAVSSASSDPRFEAVLEDEWEELEVEISVLGPLAPLPLTDPENAVRLVRVGEHGLLLRHRGRSGLLLPQVPGKYGWGARQFLEEVCHKAGLPAGAWRERGAAVSAFRCSIFHGSSSLLGTGLGRGGG